MMMGETDVSAVMDQQIASQWIVIDVLLAFRSRTLKLAHGVAVRVTT
jgi:hypothetical protein